MPLLYSNIPGEIMTQVQKTLPECTEEVKERAPQGKFYTKYFAVTTTRNQIDKIIAKCEKETPEGMSVFDKHEKKLLKMIWVQKKMKCVSAKPIFGSEWSESALAIYHKIFQEEFQ